MGGRELQYLITSRITNCIQNNYQSEAISKLSSLDSCKKRKLLTIALDVNDRGGHPGNQLGDTDAERGESDRRREL